MTHVWLPHTDAQSRIGGLPAGVSASVWDGSDRIPEGLDEVQLLVTPFLAGNSYRIAELIPQMKKLRLVQSVLAGIDWLEPIVPPGVVICNTGAANAKPIAEWVVASLLSHLRELPKFAQLQKDQRWQVSLSGSLAGRRVSILGYGPIAQALEQMLIPFGPSVRVFARSARGRIEDVRTLRNALPVTDVLVVLTPLTESTRGLVGAEVLAALPDGAIVVNAARGPVVDTDALLHELLSGRLHAMLDVTDPEPLPPGHALWTAPNCVVSPHVAGATTRFFDNVYPIIRAQIERFAAGLEPVEVVRR